MSPADRLTAARRLKGLEPSICAADRLEALPPQARRIVQGVANDREMDVLVLFEDYPHKGPVIAARHDAFALLSQHVNAHGYRLWTIEQIGEWFGISRQAVFSARSKSRKFTPRVNGRAGARMR